MRLRASAMENHAPRSISGILSRRRERGGHSISHTLLTSFSGSQSPSTAHAETSFPDAWRMVPSATNGPLLENPVSSWNSRIAAVSGSSSSRYSPLGIVQAPRSLFTQKGPPGWTRKTSNSPSRRRYIRMPALRFGTRNAPHLSVVAAVQMGTAEGDDKRNAGRRQANLRAEFARVRGEWGVLARRG